MAHLCGEAVPLGAFFVGDGRNIAFSLAHFTPWSARVWCSSGGRAPAETGSVTALAALGP